MLLQGSKISSAPENEVCSFLREFGIKKGTQVREGRVGCGLQEN